MIIIYKKNIISYFKSKKKFYNFIYKKSSISFIHIVNLFFINI